MILYVFWEFLILKSCCFFWGILVFNNLVIEFLFEYKYVMLYSLIRKIKKIWWLKWEIICKRNLFCVVLLIRKWNCCVFMEVFDMFKWKRGSLRKMVCKMFFKYYWFFLIVYIWKNIDFFVVIGVIICYLVCCGRLEVFFFSEVVLNILLGLWSCIYF